MRIPIRIAVPTTAVPPIAVLSPLELSFPSTIEFPRRAHRVSISRLHLSPLGLRFPSTVGFPHRVHRVLLSRLHPFGTILSACLSCLGNHSCMDRCQAACMKYERRTITPITTDCCLVVKLLLILGRGNVSAQHRTCRLGNHSCMDRYQAACMKYERRTIKPITTIVMLLLILTWNNASDKTPSLSTTTTSTLQNSSISLRIQNSSFRMLDCTFAAVVVEVT